MKVVIGSDKDGFALKETIKEWLTSNDYEVVDVTPEPAEDFVESSLKVTHEVLENNIKKAIMFDMTAMHNGAKALAIGSGIVGETLDKSIIEYYLHTEYAGGRHQVRLDMLEKMI